jgi:hypothetical protein
MSPSSWPVPTLPQSVFWAVTTLRMTQSSPLLLCHGSLEVPESLSQAARPGQTSRGSRRGLWSFIPKEVGSHLLSSPPVLLYLSCSLPPPLPAKNSSWSPSSLAPWEQHHHDNRTISPHRARQGLTCPEAVVSKGQHAASRWLWVFSSTGYKRHF